MDFFLSSDVGWGQLNYLICMEYTTVDAQGKISVHKYTEPSNYLVEAAVVKRHPIEQLKIVTKTQSNVGQHIPFFNSFIENLQKNDSSIEEIARILHKEKCKLSDVVGLQNSELTRTFLQVGNALSSTKSAIKQRLPEPYSFIDIDTRESVDHVMNSLDLPNAEVILTYGADKDLRIRQFFSNLVSMASEHQNKKMLKVFVELIIKWNILDQEGSRLIEQEVFNKANKDVLKIFLQCRVDSHIEKLFGDNVLAALFGNCNVKIGSLKRKKQFSVNATGFKGFSVLYYAVKNKQFKKVKFLLDRGAEPNSRTRKRATPLVLVLWEPDVYKIKNEKCAELLLQYGADPFLRSSDWVSFNSYVLNKGLLPSKNATLCAPVDYFTELALAYTCIWEADGIRSIISYSQAMMELDKIIEKDDYLSNFYSKCKQQIKILKEDEIKNGLTMFSILSKTGQQLLRLVNDEDHKIINKFISKYSKEMVLHPYYLNALREHMRQFRKLVSHKNRAMLLISVNAKSLAPVTLVLEKIVNYLTYKDLLMFQ